MEKGWETNIQNIQVFVFKHFVKIRIKMLVRISFQTFLANITEGYKLGLFYSIPRRYMSTANAAYTK